MKTIIHTTLGLLASLLQAAGLTRLANQIDMLALGSSGIHKVGTVSSAIPCISPCDMASAIPCISPCDEAVSEHA